MHYHIVLMSTIGENIKKLRKIKGIRQTELAKALNLCQSAIAHYEKNIRTPEAHSIPKIAKILGVSVNELYGEIEIKMDKPIRTIHGNSRQSKVQEYFEQLSPNDQRVALKFIRNIAGTRKAS